LKRSWLLSAARPLPGKAAGRSVSQERLVQQVRDELEAGAEALIGDVDRGGSVTVAGFVAGNEGKLRARG
jgi:uncharacterized alpha/beta hydrolase family protein